MKLATAILLLSLGMCGCYRVTLPPIKGHHWRSSEFGYTLYRDSDGTRSAVFNGKFAGEPAQACVFDSSLGGCQNFEYDQQAIDYIVQLESSK